MILRLARGRMTGNQTKKKCDVFPTACSQQNATDGVVDDKGVGIEPLWARMRVRVSYI